MSGENSSKRSFLSNRCLLICIRRNNNLILNYKNITTSVYTLSTNEPFLWKPRIIMGWKLLYVEERKGSHSFYLSVFTGSWQCWFPGAWASNLVSKCFFSLSVGIYLFLSGLICMPNIRFFFLSICQC